MYANIKRKVFQLLDPTSVETFWERFINGFIILLIVLNTAAVVLETVRPIYTAYEQWFTWLEIVSVAFFTLEYLLRIWTCTFISRYSHPVKGRLRYMVSTSALIDLAAILPFYLPRLFRLDFRFLRMLRLIRFIRFFKLGRYMQASRLIVRVFSEKREELVLSLVITFFLIIVASSLMYFAEHEAQPDKFSSIPETMWWAVATLTTVGYGDLYPITGIGKTLTACISILGIGMFALPAAILASGFMDAFKSRKGIKKTCPHCGKEIED